MTLQTKKQKSPTPTDKRKIRELLALPNKFAGYKIDFDFQTLFFGSVAGKKGALMVIEGDPPDVVDTTLEKFAKIFFLKTM